MSNLVEFAKSELKLAGLLDIDSDYNGELGKAVLELITVFSQQGHSGFSAELVASIFNKVSRYNPLTPLTGKDDEWFKHDDYEEDGKKVSVYQNIRCGNIFKQSNRFNGQAYTLDGKVFSDDGGQTWFTNSESMLPITFPYTPQEPEKVILS